MPSIVGILIFLAIFLLILFTVILGKGNIWTEPDYIQGNYSMRGNVVECDIRCNPNLINSCPLGSTCIRLSPDFNPCR